MFPYLKPVAQFINDCENKSYKICKKNEKYQIIENGSGTTNNNYEPCRKVKCDNVGKNCNQSDCNNCLNATVCNKVPCLVNWLIDYVDMANYGNRDKGIKTVGLGEIHAWCQSVCVFMHNILKKYIEDTKNENLVVGLEYFIDHFSGDNKGVRADMLIGGYGKNDKGKREKKIVIIELKQWSKAEVQGDASENQWKKIPSTSGKSYSEESPVIQVGEYFNSIRKSIKDKNSDDPIILYPCVYLHNMEELKIDGKPETRDNFVGHFEDKPSECPKTNVFVYLEGGGCAFTDKLKEIFNSKDGTQDAMDVFRELKRRYYTLTSNDFAEILAGKKSVVEGKECLLHPDQKYTYKNIKKAIDKKIKEAIDKKDIKEAIDNKDITKIGVINGGPGSGKTFLTMLLIRYCLEKEDIKKIFFVYDGTAPKHHIIESMNLIISKGINNERQDYVSFFESWNHFAYQCLQTTKAQEKMQLSKNISKEIKHLTKKLYFRFDPKSQDKVNCQPGLKLDIDEIDKNSVVFYDEAHRGNVDTFEKIVDKAAYTCLLYDEKQWVNNNNAVNWIKKAVSHGTKEYKLWTLFRSNMEEGYVTWVEQVLQYDKTCSNVYLEDLDFEAHLVYIDGDDIKITPDCEPTYENESITFISENQIDNTIIKDLKKIKDKMQRGLSFSEPSSEKFEFSHGIEFDHVLVVIPKSVDISGLKKCEKLRNVYRILMTRGLKTCFIYCENDKLRDHMAAYVKK